MQVFRVLSVKVTPFLQLYLVSKIENAHTFRNFNVTSVGGGGGDIGRRKGLKKKIILDAT